jgi:F0F1-type ATP synthase delta subunit
MEQIYAQVLWQLIERGTEPKEAVHALREILQTRGREALLPKIALAFERLAARENRKNALTLFVAREKDGRAAKAEAKKLLSEWDLEKQNVALAEDETLIGGWRLEGREHLVDASYKKYLLGMYNAATGVSATI